MEERPRISDSEEDSFTGSIKLVKPLFFYMSVPEVNAGDLVTMSFDTVNGMEDSHKGQVTEVDTDPDGLGCEFFLEITDKPNNNTVIHYHEGKHNGEEWSTVSRFSEFSGPTKIGKNVELEVVA